LRVVSERESSRTLRFRPPAGRELSTVRRD
jgi:hypothetical protein